MSRTAISLLRRTTVANAPCATSIRSASSTTVAPADRGNPSSNAISPKNSPAPSIASVISLSPILLDMFTLPERITYMVCPRSPSRNSTVPEGCLRTRCSTLDRVSLMRLRPR